MRQRKTAAKRTPAPLQPTRMMPRLGLVPVLVAIVGAYAALWYATRQDDSLHVETWHCLCSDGSYCAVHDVGWRPRWLFRLGVVPNVRDPSGGGTSDAGATHYVRDHSGEVTALVCARGTPVVTRDPSRLLQI